MAGSLLENMVFEIINSEGDVDRAIHDDESHGQSHMLAIKSEALDTDDSVRYSFHHGRCTVRAISLPQKEGTVRLLAAHSRYPELHLAIEVSKIAAIVSCLVCTVLIILLICRFSFCKLQK